MRFSLRLALLPAVAGLFFLSSVNAVAQRGGGRGPVSAAISPDGKLVAWSVVAREGLQLHVTEVANPDPAKDKIVTPNGATSCGNTSPIWSPDGQWLAYTSTCTAKEEKPGQAQIFLWSRASGESKQLTHVVGRFKQAAWAPDGKSIAFLFVENASRDAGALDAMKPWAGVIGEDGVEVQRIYGVDIASGKGSWLSPLTLHVYEFGWAPSSKEIAYIAADAPGENNWWIAALWVAPVYPGTEHKAEQPRYAFNPAMTKAAMKGLQMAVPRYSPDGKSIAFIGGLMSDQGSTGGDVWVVPAKGGEPVDVTPGIDGTPIFEGWIDNSKIGMLEDRRGHIVAPDYDLKTRKMVPGSMVDLGEVSVSGGAIKGAVSYTDKGVFALVKSSPTTSAEVYVGPLDKLTQLTHLNDGQPKSTARVESIEWENEGFHVQGWLTYPKDYDAKKKYPMIVTVHGGPTSSAFARGAGQWSGLGYFEFQPNPRGSMGQGEAFVQANIKDFGYGDLRDILAGVDAVEKKVNVDDKRLGLTGWSYGGFMSMFASTQTGRFAAIVAGAGISNWQSYYGENSIDQWMIPFFGANVYDDPAVYAKSSAITFIHKAAQFKTPMLIIVGDRDGECPAPQSFEMWHALRDLGVKTQLVVYPNEGHGFRDPEHIRDRNARTVNWFAENMPEKK